MSWHVGEEELRAYARGELAAPMLWSADTHLASCEQCRAALAREADPVALDAGWERLDAELDAPRQGLFEGLLVRLGVAGHTARLLTATPILRRSWLFAVLSVLVMTVLMVRTADNPALFLALAPLLPLAGVAVSFGRSMDPTYEMAMVAPMHGFRLLMIRTVAVLTASLALNGLATLALPGYGLLALAWLVPALALTATGLALTARLGAVIAPVLTSSTWVGILLYARSRGDDMLAPFTVPGQAVAAVIAVVAGLALYRSRDRFDIRPMGGFQEGGAM
ncbi:zf-HC2 domain-containing protein [Streptomyces roseirectus]|uniref:Zf-HC2 domain-containing protein n=1 Tax=Streptomyces roseirectus TaxID=2768066 RepID=A0A7H0IGE3_9ACTN|nr:zf-HC2 domain-containing protein [Streptomyces roseirectus]QNP71859.1 zf-HC2 domain-containing protein [Streptomyces roseirectus]